MAPKRADAKAKAKAKEEPKARPEPKAKAKAKEEPKARPEPKAKATAAAKDEAKAKAPARPEPPKKKVVEEEPQEPEEDYDTWTTAKLQAKLKEMGATASGNKAALVERLKELAPAAKKAAAKRPPPPSKTEEPAPEPKKPKKAEPKSPTKGCKRDADGEQKGSSSSTAAEAAVTVTGPTCIFYEEGEFAAEYAKSSKGKCKKCLTSIEEGSLRIGKTVQSDKFDGKYTQWHKWPCFLQAGVLPKSTSMISGFSSLKPQDQDMISAKIPSGGDEGQAASPELKKQNQKLFEIQDMLSSLSEAQLKDMLEVNNYPTKKFGQTTAPPIAICADGILFGACTPCEVCPDGRLLLTGEGYRCRGWMNEFLKCTFRTQTPKRVEWVLTPAAKKCGKLATMKLTTGTRLFANKLKDEDDEAPKEEQKKPPFFGLTVYILEGGDSLSKKKLTKLIQENGGSTADGVANVVSFIVSSTAVSENEEHEEVQKAKELCIPGVGEDFITDSIERDELEDMGEYLLWGEARRLRKEGEIKKTTFIQKMGVSMDSDVGELAEKAHVYVDKVKKVVYSEMLSKTDVATGTNSFYTIHMLESDAEPKQYWVFRKWGRIGVSQGGVKIEEHCKCQAAAIASFQKQYAEKTGNTFGHKKDDFKKIPGLFSRIEIEHKVFAKKANNDGETPDENVGAGGGGNDQPLGKLSKAQIEKGDAVLDKVEALLNEKEKVDESDAVAKAQHNAKFQTLSAEYYTLIPHDFGAKKPPTINNQDLLGAEKALLQFYLRMGFEEIGGEEEEKLTPISGVMELNLPESLSEASNKVCSKGDINSCMKKAGPMHKKKAGKPHTPMTPDLYGAILLYTANAIYKQLNKALRDEDRSSVSAFFPYLRMLFEACARLPQQKRTLWRGIGVDLYSTYKEGSTIIWWGVSSCTSDKKVAQNFMNGCGDGATFLEIEVCTACDISEVSFYANEAESILLPGTQLEVVKKEKDGKKSKIWLKEVGRVVS